MSKKTILELMALMAFLAATTLGSYIFHENTGFAAIASGLVFGLAIIAALLIGDKVSPTQSLTSVLRTLFAKYPVPSLLALFLVILLESVYLWGKDRYHKISVEITAEESLRDTENFSFYCYPYDSQTLASKELETDSSRFYRVVVPKEWYTLYSPELRAMSVNFETKRVKLDPGISKYKLEARKKRNSLLNTRLVQGFPENMTTEWDEWSVRLDSKGSVRVSGPQQHNDRQLMRNVVRFVVTPLDSNTIGVFGIDNRGNLLHWWKEKRNGHWYGWEQGGTRKAQLSEKLVNLTTTSGVCPGNETADKRQGVRLIVETQSKAQHCWTYSPGTGWDPEFHWQPYP